MSIVAGVDFGTLSVRVSIVDSAKGRLGSATADYPLHRKREDPDHATQSHADQLRALTEAMRTALETAGVAGDRIEAIALDTTGSSVIPVGENLVPLDDYYLWCDHRSWKEAGEITRTARETKLEAIDWCGGVYSSEWGWSKLLHWLRHNPQKRSQFVTAFENCDLIAAVLCWRQRMPLQSREVSARWGHKWMFNEALGGLPPEDFFKEGRPDLHRRSRENRRPVRHFGSTSRASIRGVGREAGIAPGHLPIPVGAFDAHWDAVGSGIREGDAVNVVGTSTCIMAMAKNTGLIPGVCGVVKGSIHPDYFGIEAGLSATGDIFDAIARRAGTTVAELANGLEDYRAGQTGLLRLTWDNGDRTVLVNAELGGVTLGWNLTSTAKDELFAAIEGTEYHTRVILERMIESGTRIDRVINAGGIPQRGDTLNRVYANVMNKPILVPAGDVTSLGSAIFAFLAAGTFQTIEDAQKALCPPWKTYQPDPTEAAVYEKLFAILRKLYFGFGTGEFREALPGLRTIRETART